MRRSPIGEKVRQRVQHEAIQATALEGDKTRLGLFSLHKVDWLHISTPQRDKGTLSSGHPDYLLIGKDWLAFLEIKARNPKTGRMGSMRASQYTFHDKLRAAHAEVLTAYLPDDLDILNQWLQAKTGIVVNIDGLLT